MAETIEDKGRTFRCHHPVDQPLAIEAHPQRASESTSVSLLAAHDLCAGYQGNTVVHNVSFHIPRGACVALVGESGSGKTTVSVSVGGLHHEWTGRIELNGVPLARAARASSGEQRQQIQYIFQNPYASLNPRRSVGDSGRPLIIAGESETAARNKAGQLLERVALTHSYLNQYPNQLSGGERQWVATAQALMSEPELLVAPRSCRRGLARQNQ
jgi:peptide/nickel transport system ATP-binding protein